MSPTPSAASPPPPDDEEEYARRLAESVARRLEGSAATPMRAPFTPAEALLYLLLTRRIWMNRRVTRLELLDHLRFRASVSIDVTMPGAQELPAAALPEGVVGFYAPIAFIAHGDRLRDFDITDEGGQALSLIESRRFKVLAAEMLGKLAADALRTAGLPPADDAVEADIAAAVKGRDRPGMTPSVAVVVRGNSVYESIAEVFRTSSPLIVALPAGRRGIIKYRYEGYVAENEERHEGPRSERRRWPNLDIDRDRWAARRFTSWLVEWCVVRPMVAAAQAVAQLRAGAAFTLPRIGWRPVTFQLYRSTSAASSTHFEIAAPEGVFIERAILALRRSISTPEPRRRPAWAWRHAGVAIRYVEPALTSEQVVDQEERVGRAHLYCPGHPSTPVRIEARLRLKAEHLLGSVGAVLLIVGLLASGLILDVQGHSAVAEPAVALIVLVPTLYGGFVAQRIDHEVVRTMVAGIRMVVVGASLLSLVAAGTLAISGIAQRPLIWLCCLLGASTCLIVLVVALARSWRAQRAPASAK